jgi:hypothetical protein
MLKDLKLIAVNKINYFRLKKLGYAGDSFNDVITRLLDEISPGIHFGLEARDGYQVNASKSNFSGGEADIG